MPERRPSGALESAVLAALWAAGRPLTPAQVRTGLDEDLAYTTVMTTLSRLHDKGVVHRERVGRAFAYQPVVDIAEAAATEMHALMRRTGDRSSVLARFVGTLDEDDERVLRTLLGRPRKGRRT